jgi:hypothetical protein
MLVDPAVHGRVRLKLQISFDVCPEAVLGRTIGIWLRMNDEKVASQNKALQKKKKS